MLAVAEDVNRECLALVVDISLSDIRVARRLDHTAELRRPLSMLVLLRETSGIKLHRQTHFSLFTNTFAPV